MNCFNPKLSELSPYDVPQYSNYIKLNQNESPYDIPDHLKDSIATAIHEAKWNRYPDGISGRLSQMLASKAGAKPENIICGNGSNELIQMLLMALPRNQKELIVPSPTFSLYQRLALLLNRPIQWVPLLDDFSFDIERIIESSRKGALLILTSPNNPTGTSIDYNRLIKILEKTSIPVLLDEAYHEFNPVDTVKLITEFPKLLLLRTFSKALSAAGLRLGYLIGSSPVIRELRKVKLPFSVGIFQQVAGIKLLEQQQIFIEYAKKIVTERDAMYQIMNQINGIKVIRSEGNFLLFRCLSRKASDLYRNMMDRGILLRQFEHPALVDWIRVSVGTAHENQIFMNHLEQIVNGAGK